MTIASNLVGMPFPLAYTSGAHLRLDSPPEKPCPSWVGALRGDDRELGGGEHRVLTVSEPESEHE